MSEVNGSFITEIDGVKYYTDGIIKGNLSIGVNIGYVNLDANYNTVSGDWSYDINAETPNQFNHEHDYKTKKSDIPISVNTHGEVTISIHHGLFEAGLIRFPDGTWGAMGGLNIGIQEYFDLSITTSGTVPVYTDNLSSYNSIRVEPDGTIVETRFEPRLRIH